MVEKVPRTIYRPDEKSHKNTGELETNFPKSKMLKTSNINLTSVSEHFRKKWKQHVQFSDQQIQLEKIFLYISVLSTLRYKKCLYILTLPNCNEQFKDQICIN